MRLWTRLIPLEAVWSTALELAVTHGHSPYDTLFVATARYCKTKVLSYDQRLLTVFPNNTTVIKEFLQPRG
jgi:predicted nucleic acid-binding protein